ncbi:MAG: hypothetical protein NWS20_04935 [Rickettsiaceae bacterium]|nr:hypothetical protein [Rickettsiaceae bacterium]MDP4832492.1 hypothetical protein [Rickettsiaceae bacterium]MDP5020495.1 hypothetical protein [Rickettsiaceae bacterium]MDP5083668.1 hypothetical protein [Rickettsiaceae bacterium]
MTISYNDVIKFWFEETTPAQKWIKDNKFDALLYDAGIFFLLYHNITVRKFQLNLL